MAIRRVIESDLSGKQDAATVTFGLGDTWYEVDLTDQERKELEQALKTYLKAGRKASPKTGNKRVVPETTPEERKKIRAWGWEQGYTEKQLAPRGQIPKYVQTAYDEAHGIDRST